MNDQTIIKVNGVQYRQKYRTCNKDGCKCHRGQKHGPYWQAYDGNGGATYLGKVLPREVLEHQKLLKASHAQIQKVKSSVIKKRTQLERDLERARIELRAVECLVAGDYAAPQVLTDLGLGKLAVKVAQK